MHVNRNKIAAVSTSISARYITENEVNPILIMGEKC